MWCKVFCLLVVVKGLLGSPAGPYRPPYVAHPPPVHHGPRHVPPPYRPDPYHHAPPHHPVEKKLPRRCHTDYTPVVSKECHTEYSKECHTETVPKYKTEYVPECQQLSRKKCRPTTRPVPDQDCHQTYEEKCTTETQHSYDLDYEAKCHPVHKRVCHATVSYSYGETGDGYRRKRGAGRHPGKCEVLTKDHCKKVPVKRPKYIDVPVCSNVPRYECVPTIRQVPDTICEDVPYEKCAKVPTQVVLDVPIETCHDVPHEVCHDVTKSVPTTTCKDYKH